MEPLLDRATAPLLLWSLLQITPQLPAKCGAKSCVCLVPEPQCQGKAYQFSTSRGAPPCLASTFGRTESDLFVPNGLNDSRNVALVVRPGQLKAFDTCALAGCACRIAGQVLFELELCLLLSSNAAQTRGSRISHTRAIRRYLVPAG